jgi:MFS family permease
VATLISCAYQYGLGYLLPALRAEGVSLPRAGLLVSAPIAGTTVGLVFAGTAADRYGERWVLGVGLAVAGAFVLGAASAHGLGGRAALLVAGGAFASTAQATSGRLVLRFPARRRGIAMGIRQTAQPLGVVLAALVLPQLAHGGTSRAFAAVTERAGPAAAGRVMGAQNSGQNLVGAATPPVLGAVIAAAGAGAGGYALAFVIGAVAAAVAVPCIPVRTERNLGTVPTSPAFDPGLTQEGGPA